MVVPVAIVQVDLISASIAATGALLVYDWIFVTFADEVKLVWQARWNAGKVLFILNRYLPLVDTFLSFHLLTGDLSNEFCLEGFKAVTWLIVVGEIISESILMMRTYAIWEGSRIVLGLLITLALITFVPAIVVTQLEIESFAYVGTPIGCGKSQNSSAIIFIAFVLLMFCETVILILTVIQAWKHLRHTRTPFLVSLYQDGVIYYVFLLTMSTINVIIPLAAPPEFENWLTTPQRVIHSLLCTRVILHIRSGNTEPDMLITRTKTAMSFHAATIPTAQSESDGSQLESGLVNRESRGEGDGLYQSGDEIEVVRRTPKGSVEIHDEKSG